MTKFSKVELEKSVDLAKKALQEATNEWEINQVRSKYLGAKSPIQSWLNDLPGLSIEEKKLQGPLLNQAKKQLEQLARERIEGLLEEQAFPPIDISTPEYGQPYGHLHPISHVLSTVYDVFSSLGFAIVDGPEIESDWYNFEALNQPPEHPARDMQDTFYLKKQGVDEPDTHLPRTQTSAMQVRFMEQHEPPFKIIVPGRVFRNEDEDRTHSWSFYQIEGLVVGENVSLSDLKGTLNHVMRAILGEETKIRLRPSFFPYTEPSVEIDAWYNGEWLEMAGAGMVHPQVLENAGIDSVRYSGFAFGLGAERIAMVKYGVSDIRYFWRPNFRYLRQF
ncbi:phenylalanine--tRNA ligase subunit alpha [bacterium]|nr:phenylalanine--tRNA ligase subunit alpha [bacterium]